MKLFNNIRSRKRGFTLIETLVALAILTVVLGSTVTLSRTLADQSRKTEDISQMNSIAEEAINNLRFLRDASVTATGSTREDNLGNALGFPRSTNSTIAGAFIATNVPGQPAIEKGGPVNLEWCHTKNSVSGSEPGRKCSDQPELFVSPIGIDDSNPGCGANEGTCYISQRTRTEPNQLLINDDSFTLVAVRKTPFPSSSSCFGSTTNSNRLIVDTTTPLAVQKTCIYTKKDRADWDFYKKNIHIQRKNNIYTGNNNNDLDSWTYRISVKVTNYYDPTSSVVKSATVTDFQPKNLIYSQ